MSRSISGGHLFGEVIRSLALENASLTESSYEPGSRVPFHSHESAGFCLVLGGSLTRDYRFFQADHPRGSLSFHPAGELHSEAILTNGARLFSIQIRDATLRGFAEAGIRLDDRFSSSVGSPPGIASSIYREFRGGDDLSPLAIDALVFELAIETSRAVSRRKHGRPAWLDRVEALIEASYSEPLTLSSIAKEAGVHPAHLSRAFKAAHGIPVGEAIRQRRVLQAKTLIRETDYSLSEIALMSGFSSQGHMSTAFSRLTGLTPGSYRASIA